MKKIAFITLLGCAVATMSFAQQQPQEQVKVKKTANLGEKVHNTFSKHKHYNGYKVKKTKNVNGKDVKNKTKVKTE